MKIIYRVDTDDQKKLDLINNAVKSESVILPKDDMIEIYVIDDEGHVKELRRAKG